MNNVKTNGANHPQHSNKPSCQTPQGVKSQEKPSYDLQELKKQVGITPFSQRIQLDSNGYSACPFHNGDSDKSFHIVQKENGAFIGTCFSECGKSFDAIEFVVKHDDVKTGEAIRKLVALVAENGEAPASVLHKPKPAAPMTAEAWVKAGRAVTDSDVAKLSASRPKSATPSAATLNALGFRMAEMHGRMFLAAPYRSGKTFYTVKARNIATKEFIQENSVSQKGLFNIDAVTAGCDVYIVESELDAAVLHENGYTAVSVINAKQSQIEPEVLKQLTKAYRIFLVGDQDAPGQICMDNLARLLPVEKTYRMSFDTAKDVGELAADKEMATLYGCFKEQWEALKVDATASWVAHNIPFVSELSSEPQKWVIYQLLPHGCYLLITGKFGGTKSLTALNLAKGIEAGGIILGRKVTGKTPVLYVDRENPRDVIGVRRAKLGIPDNQIRYWGDWIDGMETPNLDDPRLAEFAVREKGVIIFDSLTDWLEGESENDPSKMTEVSRKFRRLARLGAGVIVLHHDNKNGAGYRGSTAIPAGSDMAIKMAKNEMTNVIEIRTERFRMCAPWEMDIVYDFATDPWTCTVLKDRNAQDGYKQAAVDELETVEGVIATYHKEYDDKPVNQIQLIGLLKAAGISKDRALAMLAKGVREKKWAFKPGARNSVLYYLPGHEPKPEPKPEPKAKSKGKAASTKFKAASESTPVESTPGECQTVQASLA